MEALLRTKFYVPPLRTNLVARPHLIERLDAGLQRRHKLTLVSAPAGFGKTALLSEWVSRCQQPSAWLSLDKRDSAPRRFLAYLFAALQTVSSSPSQGVLGMLESPQPPPIESILTALINDITTSPDHFILVLDDYHLVNAKRDDASGSVGGALSFLIQHLPPQMHLVIATREEPLLPLGRLRVRGQLTEMRESDLRFSRSETTEFLNPIMGLNLSAQNIAVLESRTEGWVGGLQLAALSMQSHKDRGSFIRDFAGSNRLIVEYLLEEVLLAQPEPVQQFLLQTSILGRFTGPLCDALLQNDSALPDGQTMLDSLEQQNLFVMPLDDRRQWYRYHRLFADLLSYRLKQQTDGPSMDELHRRAGNWYSQHGFTDDAIEHMLAANDFIQAAQIIERERHSALSTYGEMSIYLPWLRSLPEELILERPKLALVYGWALLRTGQFAQIERYLKAAEARLRTSSTLSTDAELMGEIAGLRSQLVRLQGDTPGSITLAEKALASVSEDNLFVRSSVNENLGIAYLANGDLPAACQAYSTAIEQGIAVRNSYMTLCAYRALGRVQHQQGQLFQAASTYRQGLDYAARVSTDRDLRLPVAGDLYIGLSELLWEQNELDTALDYANQGLELSRLGKDVCAEVLGLLALAKINQAQNDHEGAIKAFQAIKALANERQPVERTGILNWIQPYEVLLWLDQGRQDAAAHWAESFKLDILDGVLYQFDYFVLARVYMEQGNQKKALRLLEGLNKEAKATGRVDHLIRILTHQVVALAEDNRMTSAIEKLQEALRLGQPEGYVRTIINGGPTMFGLLRQVAAQTGITDYINELLETFPQEGTSRPPSAAGTGLPNLLIEPLSEREIEVLQLIAEGLTNQQVANRLHISLYTVKAHARNIYAKLGVNNRMEAVVRGRASGVLS